MVDLEKIIIIKLLKYIPQYYGNSKKYDQTKRTALRHVQILFHFQPRSISPTGVYFANMYYLFFSVLSISISGYSLLFHNGYCKLALVFFRRRINT